jgi:hypothetical protein
MPLLNRYDTPAFLPDFNRIPGQLEAWHRAVSGWFDAIIADDQGSAGSTPMLYYNAARFDPGGSVVEQAITWNAFPKELIRRYGRDRALILADRLWPIESYRSHPPNPDDPTGKLGVLYRPQEEYCEWHVVRQAHSGKILRVTFTSEPPEYWQALFGLVPGSDPVPDMPFPGDQDDLVQLYRELVSPQVQLVDLIAAKNIVDQDGNVLARKGQYNIYNRWNTTDGIAHLNSPPNSLVAEIKLGADATILYTDAQGRLLVEPDALIACAGYGGANRNSDPTIGASVNALSRFGANVTLRNPVGLFMDHIDLSGWDAPDGKGVEDCLQIVRGLPGMIERLQVEVPAHRGFDVGDITIAGVPISYGGQIAECITVKLVGLANVHLEPLVGPVVAGTTMGVIDPFNPRVVSLVDPAEPIPPGVVEAFVDQGTGDKPVVPKTPERAAVRTAVVRSHAVRKQHHRFRY